jgi:hypothetical protein
MIRKLDFDPKLVTLKGVAQLILGTKNYARIGRIDVAANIYVKVSHAKCTGIA